VIDRKRLVALELRQVARSRVAVAAVFIVLLAGIVAALLGVRSVAARERALARLAPDLAEHVAQLQAAHPADGKLGLPLLSPDAADGACPDTVGRTVDRAR
jgi:hypothetical protein